MIRRFQLLYLVYKRLLKIEELLMAVSSDVQALVDRIDALPVKDGAEAAQRAEDLQAVADAVARAEAKEVPAVPPSV